MTSPAALPFEQPDATGTARLKVLVVTSYFGNCAPGGIGGGVAIRYRHYVRALRARRHEVRVLSPALGTLPSVVAKSHIGYPGHRNAVPSPSALAILQRGVRWADVVVFNDLEITPQLALICAVERRPSLYSIHTDLRAINPNPLVQKLVAFHAYMQVCRRERRVRGTMTPPARDGRCRARAS